MHPPAYNQAAWTIPDYLGEFLSTDPQVWLEVVMCFLEDSASNLARLDQEISRSDTRAAGLTLHTLKGSSRQIGALHIGNLFEEMEISLQQDGVDAARPFLSGLHAAYDSVRAEMEDAIHVLADGRPKG